MKRFACFFLKSAMWLSIIAATIWLVMAGTAAPGEPDYLRFPPERGDFYCVVTKITDGDTVHAAVLVDLGRVRLWGMDAPELPSAEGKKAKKELEGMLPLNTVLRCRLFGREKWGRLLWDAELSDKVWVTKRMMENGVARPYANLEMREDEP